MSVAFNKESDQIVQIENNPKPKNVKQVPIEKMTSRTLRAEASQLQKIFNKYDTNRDGFLSVNELKFLISTNPKESQDIPKSVAKYLNKYDANHDGKLSFNEFYKLARENEWIMREWCVNYCEFIIPPNKQEVEVGEIPLTPIDPDPITDDDEGFKFWPPMLTMISFSIIEIIFFIIDVACLKEYDEKKLSEVGQTATGPMATLFIFNPFRRYEAWRFLTYMFVHIGVMHLMNNLIIQIFFGIPLEYGQGCWRVSLIYLSGVLAGSLGTSFENPKIYLAGASAGVYALITAHVASLIMNWSELKSATYQLIFFALFIGNDIGMSYYLHKTKPYDNVGHMAHLCGGLAGLLVGIGILKNIVLKPHEKVIWWMAITIFSALMIVGVCYQFLYPEHFP